MYICTRKKRAIIIMTRILLNITLYHQDMHRDYSLFIVACCNCCKAHKVKERKLYRFKKIMLSIYDRNTCTISENEHTLTQHNCGTINQIMFKNIRSSIFLRCLKKFRIKIKSLRSIIKNKMS